MHNIPSLILLIVLIISWKHEIVGGIAFILAGLLYIILLMMNPFEWYMLSWSLIIAGPAFLIGILFTVGWFKKKKITRIA
jgi:signal transduction histidine kinase